MKVKDKMTTDLYTITPDTTHPHAVRLMQEHNIRHLPVVTDEGELVGLISRTDLLSSGPSPASTLSVYEIVTLLDRLTVKQTMTTPVFAVDEDCDLADAARYMLQKKIGCLPVVKHGHLIGIITETDMLRALADMLDLNDPQQDSPADALLIIGGK